jgi:hypothetical protein
LVGKGAASVAEEVAVGHEGLLDDVLDVEGRDEGGEEVGEEGEVAEAEAVEEEVDGGGEGGGELEEVADLPEVEGVEDEVVGLLRTVVALDLGQHHEQQHDRGEDVPEDLHVAQPVVHVAGDHQLSRGLRGHLRGVDVGADGVGLH